MYSGISYKLNDSTKQEQGWDPDKHKNEATLTASSAPSLSQRSIARESLLIACQSLPSASMASTGSST